MRPQTVKKYKLGEVCHFITGQRRKSSDGTFLAYGAGEKATAKTNKTNCPEETIRLTRKGTVGAVYWHTEPFWMEEASYCVDPKEMINKRYLYHWLAMKSSEIVHLAVGDILPSLPLTSLCNLEIEVPDMDYQLWCVNILERMLDDKDWYITNIHEEIRLNSQLENGYLEKFVDVFDENKN